MTDHSLMPRVALALALTAGTATLATAQGEQRYRLVELGGKALPVEVEREGRCREYVTQATLTLRPDSLWALEYTKREVCGDRAEVETEREDGRYSVVADTIRFHDDDDDRDDRDDQDDDDLDLDDLATATRSPEGALAGRLEDGRTTLVFRP